MRRRDFLVAGSLAGLSLPLARAESEAPQPVPPPIPEHLTPYLQNPSATSMSVCCLSRTATQARVAYRATDGSASAEEVASMVAIPGTPWKRFCAGLSGLERGAACAYRVTLVTEQGEHAFPEYTFRTLDPEAREVSVAIFNDIHDNLQTFEAAVSRIAPGDFEWSLLIGDMINDPSARNGAEHVMLLWNAYVERLEGHSKPIVYMRGNHEYRGNFARHLGHLVDLPHLDMEEPLAQRWQFALRAGPVAFIALDTGEDDNPQTPDDNYRRPRQMEAYRRQQTPWLRDATAQPQWRDAPHRVFASHIPLHEPRGEFSIVSRDEWDGVLKEGGAHVMVAGHTHVWKVIEAGKPFTHPAKPEPLVDQSFAPIAVGGGPALGNGTVMLLKADPARLTITALAARDGAKLFEVVRTAE